MYKSNIMSTKKSKSWRTSAVAIAGILLSLCILVLVFVGKATLPEARDAFTGLGVLLGIIYGFVSKDAKATHSELSNRNIIEGNDPKKEEK